ncbi:hypothetical protein R1flu_027343 [Riccia fluitans]|uniref:MYND-type domain-containing protein n=1 Tax=Riccia fluitans TaxID=41844 RepID=A0ABD1XJ20_9MARC
MNQRLEREREIIEFSVSDDLRFLFLLQLEPPLVMISGTEESSSTMPPSQSSIRPTSVVHISTIKPEKCPAVELSNLRELENQLQMSTTLTPSHGASYKLLCLNKGGGPIKCQGRSRSKSRCWCQENSPEILKKKLFRMYSTSRSVMRNVKETRPSQQQLISSRESNKSLISSKQPLQLLQRKRPPTEADEPYEEPRKLARSPSLTHKCQGNAFDSLPDDLLVCILGALISTASSPADYASALLTCRRFWAAASHPQVVANASPGALAVKASSWSDGAHRFLKLCADAGNVEACYTLGTIRFYCLFNRGGGASLMAKAAMQSHASALHSLAVIQFNGSGGTRKDKDLKAGVALCVRAATLGHVDAMRELGHCLQDGYGVSRNLYEGRRLLLEANAREAAAAVVASPGSFMETAFQLSAAAAGSTTALVCPEGRHHQSAAATTANMNVVVSDNHHPGEQVGILDQTRAQLQREGLDRQHMYKLLQGGGSCSLLSDFGCTVPPPKLHISNRFLVDWFEINPPVAGLRLCSHGNCGRPETRRHEFRRCSACGCVNYCSRACQAMDWKIRHKYDCQPVADWGERHGDNEGEEDEQLAYEDMDDS